MIEVNTKKINDQVGKLAYYIKEYEKNTFNIFNELSKLDSYWKGEDASRFQLKIQKEKETAIYINDDLNNIKKFYQKVDSYYENIDNKK